jgi:DNA-binding NtrC family response regulator
VKGADGHGAVARTIERMEESISHLANDIRLLREVLSKDIGHQDGSEDKGNARALAGSAAERDALVRALAATRENITLTARHFGVSRVTLYRMLRRHGISLRPYSKRRQRRPEMLSASALSSGGRADGGARSTQAR